MKASIPNIVVIVPAAGIGSRMGADRPKQYLTLEKQSGSGIKTKTILEHSLDALLNHPAIYRIIVVLHSNDRYFRELPLAKNDRISTVVGGDSRADSVMAGLKEASDATWVLIHDSVRPCLKFQDLTKLLMLTEQSKVGGLLVAPLYDTVKQVSSRSGEKHVIQTVKREMLWRALTPQIFPRALLLQCLTRALAEGAAITDEASALEYCGYSPEFVVGRSDNIKVTCVEDVAFARFYLMKKEKHEDTKALNTQQSSDKEATSMRIGHGFDVHAFGGKGPLIIGGVSIPFDKGFIAHSDGDVALHALMDALLGAAAMGDIGTLFPDTNPEFRGVDSRHLLRDVWGRLKQKEYRLVNVDVTLIAQEPKIQPYVLAMRKNIAADLGCDLDAVNVKASTTEKLGFTGRGEGIACEAVALMAK